MMKNKILGIFVLVVLIFGSFFVIGVTQLPTVSFKYDFTNDTLNNSNIYPTDAILLKINTDNYTSCYYNQIPLDNYGKVHEKEITGLEEGVHEFNINCEDGPVMKIIFTTKIPVYAEYISISKDSPLRAGTYGVTLKVSKPVLETPELTYNFDNNVPKKISLEKAGEYWRGYLVIPESVGEVVGSFSFSAKDLEGQSGNNIEGSSVFIVDTVKPKTIEVIDSTGYEGKIVLNWYYEDNVEEYRIYRSENPNIDKTDFYRIADSGSSEYEYGYSDTYVEKGKTYYYKIAAVDEAGNVGELSLETYATVLISKTSNTSSGLDLKLIGKVDNFITEIISVIEDSEFVKASQRDEKESEIFEKMKLNKEIESSLSELENLKTSVEKYKLQDLSEEELEKKINSASLKLEVIRKKIPESITITEEKSIKGSLEESTLQKALLEYNENNLDESTDKNIKAVLNLIEDKGLEISRTFYSLQIIYLDGTRKDVTFVKENLDSEMERDSSVKFILVIPKNIAEDISDVAIMNLDYEIIKSDPVVAFSSDSKEIIYYFEKELSLPDLEETIIAPIKEIDSTAKITGNFVGNISTGSSIGIIILFVVFLGLVFYFVYLKKSPGPKNVLIVLEKIKKVKELKDEGKNNEAIELYNMVKEEYKKLSDKDKNLALQEIQKIGLK